MSTPFKIISIFLIAFLIGGGLYIAVYSPIDTYRAVHNTTGYKATVEENSSTLRQSTGKLYVTYTDNSGTTLYRQQVIGGDTLYKKGQQVTVYRRSNGTLAVNSLSVKSIALGALMTIAGSVLAVVLVKSFKKQSLI